MAESIFEPVHKYDELLITVGGEMERFSHLQILIFVNIISEGNGHVY